MFVKKEYYSEMKKRTSMIEKKMDLIEECLSDNAKEQMEQYNRDKFNEIQKKVENNKQNIKIDEKLKDEFSKIAEEALKLAERLCLNITVESDEDSGIIRYASGFFLFDDTVNNERKEFLELVEKSSSIQAFARENTIEIVLQYDFYK